MFLCFGLSYREEEHLPLHAPWQRLAYLLNVEIHVPAFSSAPPAPRAAFVALLQK